MKTCAILILATAVALPAQQHVSVPRADGHKTPLLVYTPVPAPTTCAPLAVISHGAGGSENGYRYLAEAMANLGYTAVVMGHVESGLNALGGDVLSKGLRRGVQSLVADPVAEQDRLLDITAALQWSEHQCHAPFRVLLGHSMGSATVMLEAGALNLLNIPAPPEGQDRFDAYVALSPQGPGVVFPDHAWGSLRKPILILTGTSDEATNGGPESRLAPFRDLPPTENQCHWQGVIDGATHMNFAGTGPGADPVKQDVTQTIQAFLKGVQANYCPLPDSTQGLTLQSK